jgi:ABC-type cobalamin/Fe3+-siderophores transport system ATPase subunit
MSRPRSPSEHAVPPEAATGLNRHTFARFWRCALQVNPAAYSQAYRGQSHGLDEDEYNTAIAAQCEALDIKVVGIADHGSVDAVDRLRSTLSARGIVVFPGFEIASTEKVHMVCLFPENTTKDQLNRYLGKLDLTDVADGVRPSRLGCLELARRVHELGGFWYAAHITGTNGLLRLGNKDGGGLTHVWTESSLVRVAQIPKTIDELQENYQKIVRNEIPEYHRDRPIAVINAKDVAKAADLREPRASSWIKMTEPTFEAFKIAFLDPESRVRLEMEETPHSALVSLRIQGGYLDGIEAHLSEHLNTLIGGRGTGKSTLVECIRYVLELPPKGKQAQKLHQDILKENLGKSSGTIELTVRSTSQHGDRFTISRRFGEPPIVRDKTGAVSNQQPSDLLPNIEIYGQNEIFELAQDPRSRMQLLDRFLPQDHAGTGARLALRKKLVENAQKLTKAGTDRDETAELVLKLPKLQEQLAGFRKLGIESKLATIPLHARETQLMDRVVEETVRLERAVDAVYESLPDLTFLSPKALENLPHAERIEKIRAILQRLRDEVANTQEAMSVAITRGRASLMAERDAWKKAMAGGEQELDAAVASIPDMAGKSGREVGTAFRQVAQEIERIQPLKAKVSTYDQFLTTLKSERQALIAELSALRSRRNVELSAAVERLNKRLKGKMRVRLTVEGDRHQLTDFLVSCRLEGVGEKRLAWIEESGATPLAVARAIERGADSLAAEFKVSPGVAAALAKLPPSKVLELESLELEDEVDIELNVAHGTQEKYRSLARLSTGQQCTAVLHLLLLDNPDPLIVDQPEDNLDNAFIAERIVRQLRASKTERQFLFSTHNANIPVFGDAEWIGVLTADDARGILDATHQGSIDVPSIREQAAEILEGGPSAFNQRREMYGF